MTDMTEPWPPVPGTGPAGMPGTPPLTPPDPPHAFQAPLAGWPQQPAMTPPALDASYAGAAPLEAGNILAAQAPGAPRRRRGGVVVIVLLIVIGLAGLLGGGGLLARELTRKATKAEQAAALATELASRWQRLPAGKIFPATLSFANSGGDGTQVTMTRVGIVPKASCQSALEATAFQQVRPFGCIAMLRATYIDAVGAHVVSVGIAVFPSGSAASKAQSALEAANAAGGLHAVPITGTIAGAFGDAQRGHGDAQFAGPYVLLYTAGYTDGMPASAAKTNTQLASMGSGVLGALEPALTSHTSPCTMKDIKC